MGFLDHFSNFANPVGYAAGQLFGSEARDRVNAVNPIGTVTDNLYRRGIPGIMGENAQPQAHGPSGTNAEARYADISAGNAAGRKEFYDDPEMQAGRARREDLAKGYDGQELGGMRQEARGQIAGQRSAYLQQLQSKLARGGVGGARAAAISGAADQKYAQQGADSERKLAMDSSDMKRQGTNDLQEYVMRQKYGSLGTGLAYGQLGAQDRGTAAAAAANQPQKKGFLGNIFEGIF